MSKSLLLLGRRGESNDEIYLLEIFARRVCLDPLSVNASSRSGRKGQLPADRHWGVTSTAIRVQVKYLPSVLGRP